MPQRRNRYRSRRQRGGHAEDWMQEYAPKASTMAKKSSPPKTLSKSSPIPEKKLTQLKRKWLWPNFTKRLSNFFKLNKKSDSDSKKRLQKITEKAASAQRKILEPLQKISLEDFQNGHLDKRLGTPARIRRGLANIKTGSTQFDPEALVHLDTISHLMRPPNVKSSKYSEFDQAQVDNYKHKVKERHRSPELVIRTELPGWESRSPPRYRKDYEIV